MASESVTTSAHSLDHEAELVANGRVLLLLSQLGDNGSATAIVRDFYGTVAELTGADESTALPDCAGKIVYLCGDLTYATRGATGAALMRALSSAQRVLVVRQLCEALDEVDVNTIGEFVSLGRVPVDVHGVGVFYPRFFNSDVGYFDRVTAEHEFQSLTESTKPGVAHRSGIYLTPVMAKGDDLHFRLLRCSSNLMGPTANFRATDTHIVDALNQEAALLFSNAAPLNHVLAQIYPNTPATRSAKQTKAKIKAHADKTKDMPGNGIMAFCTFYDELRALKPIPGDLFDRGNGTVSAFTKMHFRLKKCVAERPGCTLPHKFSVNLYPESVFFMPLSTNRMYTHEVRPGAMDAARLPTRLGYVVRCSATEAVFSDGQTHIKRKDGHLVRLEPPAPDGLHELRGMYARENTTDALVDYADKFDFSMNTGDYRQPKYDIADEFRRYTLPAESPGLFEALVASIRFEEVRTGRKGTTLVKTDPSRGTPIVRATDQYQLPAQRFKSLHLELSRRIQARASLRVGFNNALAECYTNAYAKMGAHSDQALDLEDDSFIAIFSSYRNAEIALHFPRKLVVASKAPGGGSFEIPMTHNSVVVFSLSANRRFKHKIVLDRSRDTPANEWLGLTFRTSKTLVHYDKDGQVRFENGEALTLADEEAKLREFYRLRAQENRESDFRWPSVSHTVSRQDTLPPEPE